MPDVFISYNREDQAVARLFADALQTRGYDVWWDVTLRVGEAYDEVTEEALRRAKAVIVLWSKKSVMSRWVRAEATLADRNRTLVPCMIEPCERPIMFELTHTAELAGWNGSDDDKGWQDLLCEVRRLVERKEPAPQERTTLPPAPLPGERGDRPSLAVMPFSNRSGVAQDDAIAFGMVEDIVSAISLIPDVRVLSSGSTLAWAGAPTDLRQVGRDLGVRYALEGNVRRAGEDLRVTVQLVETETGAVLWMQKFDRPLAELATLQEDLVTEVAGRLGVQVQYAEMERALKKPGNLSAYEAVQRVLSVFAKVSLDRLPFAVAEARRAIAIAPDYGIAHAMLAIARSVQFLWTGATNADAEQEASRHAEQALELAPNDPFALAYSVHALNYLGRPIEALKHARRAVDLNPNIAMAQESLGFVYLHLGSNDEAIACFREAEHLAPGSFLAYHSHIRRSQAHFQAGRLKEAVEAMEDSYRLNPDHPITLVVRAGLCTLTDRQEDARQCVRRLREMEPATPVEIHATRIFGRVDKAQSASLIAAFHQAWTETPSG